MHGALRQGLMALPFAEKRIAVFSMLADKDMDAVIEIVKDQFDEWYLAPLALPRGQSAQVQAQKLEAHGIGHVHCLENVAAAYHAALAGASENDRITVFGSFHTVAEVMAAQQQG